MENKKLGIAKKDLKAGETFRILIGSDGFLHSDAINCFESIRIEDFL